MSFHVANRLMRFTIRDHRFLQMTMPTSRSSAVGKVSRRAAEKPVPPTDHVREVPSGV